MFDWQSIWAFVIGPYGPVVGIGAVVVYSLLRQRWPSLPGIPVIHAANPTPPQVAPTFPYLRKLLGVSPDASPADISADTAKKIKDEIEQLINLKLAAHEDEAAKLGRPTSTPTKA